eukprot:scaffold50131_cov27-Tisochrysis_lutea.AAC.3
MRWATAPAAPLRSWLAQLFACEPPHPPCPSQQRDLQTPQLGHLGPACRRRERQPSEPPELQHTRLAACAVHRWKVRARSQNHRRLGLPALVGPRATSPVVAPPMHVRIPVVFAAVRLDLSNLCPLASRRLHREHVRVPRWPLSRVVGALKPPCTRAAGLDEPASRRCGQSHHRLLHLPTSALEPSPRPVGAAALRVLARTVVAVDA